MTVVTIQQRRATSTEWSTKNPILKAGEIGFEIDTGKVKCGNGITPWNELVYISGDVNAVQNTGQSTTQVMSQKAVTDGLNTKANTSTQVIAGTGLEGGGNLSANRTLSVKYGTAAGTATQGNDSRLSDAREWTATTVSQAEAEAGTATTRRAWTAQRVHQAIAAWWNTIGAAFGKTLLRSTTATDARGSLGLGTAATSNVVQVTGQSTTGVMTQKAVTDALEGKVDKVTGSGLVKTPPTNGKPQAMLDGDWVDAPTKSIDWVIHNGGALTIDSSMNGKFILVKGDSTLTLDVHSSLPVGFNVTILPDDSKDATAHTITLDKDISNTIIGGLTTVTGVCSVALIPSTTIFAVAGSIE